jgi:hypothetical protein
MRTSFNETDYVLAYGSGSRLTFGMSHGIGLLNARCGYQRGNWIDKTPPYWT